MQSYIQYNLAVMFDRNMIINTQLVRSSLSSGVGTVKVFEAGTKYSNLFFLYVNTKCYSYSIFSVVYF